MSHVARNQNKRLYLALTNDAFRMLLSELLAEWGYQLDPAPPAEADALLLTDDARRYTLSPDRTILFSHSGCSGHNRLPLPVSPAALWATLEQHFHRPARAQMRMTLSLPVSIHARGATAPSRIVSLSPLGARLPLHRELVFDEECALILPAGAHVLHLSARVIYVTTRIDPECPFETGVIFHKIDPATQQILYEQIVFEYLSRIRARLPGWAFEVGLSYLELSPALRARL